jgi:hypothetical protein
MALTADYHPAVPVRYPDEVEHRTKLALTVNGILTGKMNNRGSVTLRASQTTTTVSDINATPFSIVIISPGTANAAAENAYVNPADYTDGQFIVTHASAVSTDRSFRYIIFG